jgi:hypothetical protein
LRIDCHIHMHPPGQILDFSSDYLKTFLPYIRLRFTPTQYNHTRPGCITCDRVVYAMMPARPQDSAWFRLAPAAGKGGCMI